MSKLIKTIKKNKVKTVLSAVLGLFVLLLVLAYGFGVRLNFLPLPAAYAGNGFVTLNQYYQRIDLAIQTNIRLDENSREKILERLVDNKIEQVFAKEKGLSYTEQEASDAYSFLQKAVSNDKVAESMGLSEAQFKKLIIEPEIIHSKLQIWFAGQKELNADAYLKSDEAQKELSTGKTFENIVLKYSDDTLSAKVGGDLGFVGLKEIPPEYYAELAKITDTQAHVTVSRYGIHIFKVLGKDSAGPEKTTRYRIQQIFIKTSEYKTWFEEQKKQFRIVRFI